MATIDQEVFEKVVEDLKHEHGHALDQAVKMAQMGIDRAQLQYEEKVQELNKQNDGLLGAVGRLQAEKVKLEEKVKELDTKMEEALRHHQMKAFEETRFQQVLKAKMALEISKLKQTIKMLRAQKARK